MQEAAATFSSTPPFAAVPVRGFAGALLVVVVVLIALIALGCGPPF